MTFKINNFVFLVTEVVAIDETVENTECFWFYMHFKNGQHKQLVFKFNTYFTYIPPHKTDKENLAKQIEIQKNQIRHYMSDNQRDLEIKL